MKYFYLYDAVRSDWNWYNEGLAARIPMVEARPAMLKSMDEYGNYFDKKSKKMWVLLDGGKEFSCRADAVRALVAELNAREMPVADCGMYYYQY